MNQKKIITLALGTLLSLGIVQTTINPPIAEASYEAPMSPARQERLAQKQMKKDGAYDTATLSSSQKALYNKLFAIQKRLADANNIDIVDKPFTSRHDHETKIHPLRLRKSDGWSYSEGAGYILISDTNWKFGSLKGTSQVTQTIAHEMGHSLRNGSNLRMGLFVALRGKHESRLEETGADRESVKLINPLPEGGWGYYLLGNNRFKSQKEKHSLTRVYYHAWKAVCNDIKNATKNRIQVSVTGTYGISYMNGKTAYPIHGLLGYTDYLGGQIAECIAKGVFLPRNLDIVPVSKLNSKCQYPGKSVIICSSPKLPNGYRALAFSYEENTQVLKRLLAEYIHAPIQNHTSYISDADVIQKAQTASSVYKKSDAVQLKEIVTLAKLEEAIQK